VIARIYILPKNEILDPAGEAVARALSDIGFDEVREVKIGKYMELSLDTSQGRNLPKRIEEMCSRLLANPTIETYQYELEGVDRV